MMMLLVLRRYLFFQERLLMIRLASFVPSIFTRCTSAGSCQLDGFQGAFYIICTKDIFPSSRHSSIQKSSFPSPKVALLFPHICLIHLPRGFLKERKKDKGEDKEYTVERAMCGFGMMYKLARGLSRADDGLPCRTFPPSFSQEKLPLSHRNY